MVTMEAEIETMQLSAKESLEPPEAEETANRTPSRAPGATWLCWRVAFALRSSRTIENIVLLF